MVQFLKIFLLTSAVSLSSIAHAANIRIVNTDGPGEGLNSNAQVAPVAGNNGTTLGQQYMNVFRAAAQFFGSRLNSNVEIRLEAAFDPLRCTESSGQLGGAGPLNAFVNFQNAPRRNTAYVGALADALAGRDLDPGGNDIGAVFNSRINGNADCLRGSRWWLGINSPAPARTISLYDTVLHEIAHGLGFLTFVDEDGVRLRSSQGTAFNDAYMLNLFDVVQNRNWAAMTDAQRSQSSLNNGSLVWSGQNVDRGAGVFTGGRNGNGQLRVFAPRTYDDGSSVSHWDTAVGPNELMEPFATPTSNSCATLLALKDMGWRTQNECGPAAANQGGAGQGAGGQGATGQGAARPGPANPGNGGSPSTNPEPNLPTIPGVR